MTDTSRCVTIPSGGVRGRVRDGGDHRCATEHHLSPHVLLRVSGGNAVEKILRAAFAVVMAAALLSGCTATPQSSDSPSAGAGSSAPADPGGSGEPTAKPTKAATTKSQPVPKVIRSGEAKPTITAKPAGTGGKVSYSDGVVLQIRDVSFGKETKAGPGMFPGRAYAILALEIKNGSERTLSLDTVVITVLDKRDKHVNPVYVAEAKVSDFAGELAPGKTSKARYAFAVPASSRSKVTVVVDFDGVHTSGVFRGRLS